MSEKHIGKVIQVTGPVLDIRFPEGELPALLNAIEIDNHGEKLTVEVAQQTGDHTVRCIAMKSTDGLVRGTAAVDTGKPITVPVGEACLGRGSGSGNHRGTMADPQKCTGIRRAGSGNRDSGNRN